MMEIDTAIDYLLAVNNLKEVPIENKHDKLRALMNVTMPINLSEKYYLAQDKVLQKNLESKKIIDADKIEFSFNIAIYLGDITLIKADAIVNACNEKLLGCFYPLHSCVDNTIHSAAGLQVRRDLISIMKNKKTEPNGECEVTKGYNLPSKYIFHTVGPRVIGIITKQDIIDLKNCYLSCLTKAVDMKLNSHAFPCIATGIYNFPSSLASKIAYETVRKFLKENNTGLKVIFDTYSKKDYLLYKEKEKEYHDN